MVVERLVEFSLNVVKKYLRVASDEGEFTSFRVCGSKCKKKNLVEMDFCIITNNGV